MSRRLIIRPEADLAEAQGWYEERVAGLGREFLESVEATLVSVSEAPEAYPVVYKVVRRALTRRFPYGLRSRRECRVYVGSPISARRKQTSKPNV